MKITVLFNLPEEDADEAEKDTLISARDVGVTLKAVGHAVELLGITKEDIGRILDIDADVVFNMIEWTGKDLVYAKKAFAKLEKLGIPYTGSRWKGYFQSANKIEMKKRFVACGIPTPKYMIWVDNEEVINNDLKYPLIIKLAVEHCSVGLTQKNVVENETELRQRARELFEEYKQPLLIEEFVEGVELQVTVLERGGRFVALPAAQLFYSNALPREQIMTYDCKWVEGSIDGSRTGIGAVELDSEIRSKASQVAIECARQLGGMDYPRVDMKIKNGEVYVLEINNNPGIDYSDDSGIGISTKSAGLSYEELLNNIIYSALERGTNRYETATI